ncbi:MAG: bifunctional folylpolyglutamate synthase/dihydrofolate synthase [Clostridiales bacterium]|nr:bifunctional folylpolyglutamate synthase/dihydrofolate synthase [Clostridiales bacterium]
MTYEEAREFIQKANQYGIVPGLDTIRELLRRLGNPQEKLKIIHVAGTNGKGSVSNFLIQILKMAGYRVGRYLSPAVFSYRERIQTSSQGNGAMEYITRQGICEAIAQIKPICKSMVEDGFAHPTTFEIETAMAFLYLWSNSVDIAIIEVGMGGRQDATNVIRQPLCSIITSISMDHMQYLGNSLEEIAREKAGIIKSGSVVVTCRQEPEVLGVLEQSCREKEATLVSTTTEKIQNVIFRPEETIFSLASGDGKAREYKIKQLGEYQIENAVLAIKAAEQIRELGYSISEEAIRSGLYEAIWRGRFEILAKEPYIILDGAHNQNAAMQLRKSIEVYFTNRRIIFMIGVLADKDYKSILEITAPLADLIITLTPNNARALSSSDLAAAASLYGKRVIDAGSIDHAVKIALHEAGKEDVIIAFGSLSYLGELLHTLENRK